MKKSMAIGVAASALAIVFLFSGCNKPAVVQTAPAKVNTAAVTTGAAASQAAASSAPAKSAAAKSAAPSPKATAKAPAPTADAFKFYKLIDIGMAKSAVDKAIGVKPKAATGEYDPENSFYYLDADGNGVYVQYDKSLKLVNKTVQYTHPAEALTPYTGKPVTKEQCDEITDGMKHADVVKLLGSEGAECNKTKSVVFGKTTVGTIYRWGNKDGSFIQVVFIEGDKAKNAMFFDAR